MPSDGPQSFVIRSDSLGVVGNFDSTILARIPNKNSLHAAQLFLRATLDETIKIRQLSKILNEDNHDLLQETGDKFFDLERQVKELQLLEQRSWIYKLFTPKKLKRARKTLVSDVFELWNSTSTKSDSMKKGYVLTPTENLPPVESGSVPRDQPISGIVVDLPRGPVTQEALTLAQEIFASLAAGNPFADPTSSDSQVGQALTATSAVSEAEASPFVSPSSRSSASSASVLGSVNLNLTVVNNTNSTTSGIAISNTCGNSGSGLASDHPPANSLTDS